MRKILSERNLVVILFVLAVIIFSFAQEDAKKVEKMYLGAEDPASSILTKPKQTAGIIETDKPGEIADQK